MSVCCYFDENYGLNYNELKLPSPALIDRTREIEAALEGECVPESEWKTFFAPVCGVIDARCFERMFKCRKLAVNYLALQAPARRFRTNIQSFNCTVPPQPASHVALADRE
jgi:hypothetical protein